MNLLITAFEPFDKEPINSSLEVMKALPKTIHGARIRTLMVPTAFHSSAQVLSQALNQAVYDYIVCLGQAGGRAAVTPERVAINLDDARIPDNQAAQPIDQVIQAKGQAAYFSQLPIKAMVAAMKEAGVPSQVSNSAGTYVCNHLMYQALYLTHTHYLQTRAGFVHLPYLTQQVIDRPHLPSLTLDQMVLGMEAAIGAIVNYHDQVDLKVSGGQNH